MRHLQPVIWSKGTFLSPQHLQAQERFVEDSASFYLNSLTPTCWGFSAIQVDTNALAEGMLSLTLATGIFPDALAFDIPSCDPAPPSRTLDECFRDGRKSCLFYLAIPRYLDDGVNVSVKQGRDSTRFMTRSLTLRDENNGVNERSVQVVRKNMQLLAEGENLEGAVLLGCTRVKRGEAGLYELDPSYIPPLIDLHAHPRLKQVLSGMIELLITRSSQLSGGRRQKNQSLADFSASDVANFWLLCTINTHLPGLRHFYASPRIQPLQLFAELSDLAGTLTAFSQTIEPRTLPNFAQDDLGQCFSELDRLIRVMLDTVVPSNFVALPLKLTRDTVYAASIEKDAWFQGRFYLAVSSDLVDADLIDRAPKLKASSTSDIETLIQRALPGLRLQHVPRPPTAIPVKLRYQYFSIEQSGSYWESVLRARNFAVYAPADILRPQMELVILLPEAV